MAESAAVLDFDADQNYLAIAADSKLKRVVDVSISVAALLAAAPVLLLVGLVVAIESGWPVLYCQERIGLGGRRFRMWKIRTMVRDAHQLRSQLEHMNEAPFPAFKVRRDPRVTRVGRLLRMSSVDELPQLWNVVRGEMSLVGPRPALPEEVRHYSARAYGRLAVRPGVTGLWQLENRARRLSDFEDWIECDLRYVASWSVRNDLRLIVRTFRAVVTLTGH